MSLVHSHVHKQVSGAAILFQEGQHLQEAKCGFPVVGLPCRNAVANSRDCGIHCFCARMVSIRRCTSPDSRALVDTFRFFQILQPACHQTSLNFPSVLSQVFHSEHSACGDHVRSAR